MNGLPKKAEFNSLLANSSQYIFNSQANSSKSMSSLSQMLSQQNNGKSVDLSKNYSSGSFSQVFQTPVAPRPSFNSSTTQAYPNKNELSDKYNPFYTPQKTITKRNNLSEYSLLPKQSEGEFHSQMTTKENYQNKGLLASNQTSDKSKELISFTNYINNNTNLINQKLSSQQEGIDQKSYASRFSQKYYANPNKKLDSNSSRHAQANSLQIEPTFLSDREIQLPTIVSSKNSQFKNQNGNQITNEIPSDKSTQSHTNSSENDSNYTPIQNKSDLLKNANSPTTTKKEGYLKDWLIGSTSRNFLPVSANEIKQDSTNEILPPNTQQSQFNQPIISNGQQYKAMIAHRRYIIRKNSKELSNRIQSSFDASEQLSSSQDSIQTPQSNQQLLMQNQVKPSPSPSLFKQINVTSSQDQEQQQENIQRLQSKQKLSNLISTPSKSALQQILQSPTSNSSLFSPSPTDITLQQKRALYKPRRNKLQLWMNEVNNELGNSVGGNETNTENSINNYRKVKTEQSYQEEESDQNLVQYLPSAVEEQNKQTRSSFLLPQINDQNEKIQKRSLIFLRQPSIKIYKESENPESKNTNSFILGSQNEKDKNNSLNLQQRHHHKSMSTLFQSQHNQQNQNQEQEEQKPQNSSYNRTMIRHMSEPKISLNILKKSQDQNVNTIQTFENLVTQKLEQKRTTLGEMPAELQNENKNSYSVHGATKSLTFIPNSSSNKMKIKFVKEVKSILKNKLDPKQQSQKTLQNICESDESDDQSQVRESYASTKAGESQTTVSGLSFQRDNQKSQISYEQLPIRNTRLLKRVNFQERVSVLDMRTRAETITSISKQQSQNHNDELKNKQKKQHL